MLKKLLILAVLVTSISAAERASAQHLGQFKEPINPQTGMSSAYYAFRLKASFEIQKLWLPQYGDFRAARVVSMPGPDSPLHQLGLTVGDVVTRLDGVPIHTNSELDRHVRVTHVRYIKAGTRQVRNGTIYIPTNGLNYPDGNAMLP